MHISRLCDLQLDARALRAGVLDELRRVVEFDAYVWVLTDPQTCVGTDPLADVPCLDELPRLIELKYLTRANRWTSLQRNQVAFLDWDTCGDLSRSLMWRELLAKYDVGDVASTVFRDRFGCWAFLDLWRIGRREPFAAAEAQLLGAVAREVTSALRRAQAATFTARRPHALRHTGRRATAEPDTRRAGTNT